MRDTKQAVAREMEAYFEGDRRRIEHAHKVTAYCEELLKSEQGDYSVVIAAGLLHDIGIHEAERKYGSAAGKYQEIEGPAIARDILKRLNFPQDKVEEVCEIIANHHSPGKINSQNFKILYDSDWLVNLRDDYASADQEKLHRIINRVFLTQTGRNLAQRIYL